MTKANCRTVVKLHTRDEYDGMYGRICGMTDGGDAYIIKHRPLKFPRLRSTTLHCFRPEEIEILKEILN